MRSSDLHTITLERAVNHRSRSTQYLHISYHDDSNKETTPVVHNVGEQLSMLVSAHECG